MKELQKFVNEHEKTIAEHAPKGWKYMGTYCYVLGFGSYHVAVIWEISNYADLDALRNHDDPIFWKLMEQKLDFMTSEPTPSWLLRNVGDTLITEKEEKS